MVSVGDPREIGTIYGFKQSWRKVGWTLDSIRSRSIGKGEGTTDWKRVVENRIAAEGRQIQSTS